MIIIGVDFHPEFQQIAAVDTQTGELLERRLQHPNEAESFYRELVTRSAQVRVAMEASGHARWFERLLGELQIELMDRRCRRDPNQTSTKAEDRSARCAVDSEADAEG